MRNEKFGKILFLCTGNYFRSRFAELYFNHIAEKKQLAWYAESRGIRQNIAESPRPEPLSPHAHRALLQRNIPVEPSPRFPLSYSPHDLKSADRIIIVCEREHRPMIEHELPALTDKIEFWHIEDVDRTHPEVAISVLVTHLDNLPANLS